ncbi:MAG TPA: hypothetical protein VMR17_17915 [Xanthobacteraceae bacterium]|nr:hypothetical protein [Xanthobacteraceae bacterium]
MVAAQRHQPRAFDRRADNRDPAEIVDIETRIMAQQIRAQVRCLPGCRQAIKRGAIAVQTLQTVRCHDFVAFQNKKVIAGAGALRNCDP